MKESNIENDLEKVNLLDLNHKIMFDSVYANLLKKIKFYIQSNRVIRDTGFEMFETEWKNYKIDLSAVIESLISKPYLLIPFNLEDIIEGI